jgi:hypothetical protein
MLLVRPLQQQGVHELGCCDVRRQERRSLVPEKTPVVRVSLAVRELRPHFCALNFGLHFAA